jgi:hypothetical protein
LPGQFFADLIGAFDQPVEHPFADGGALCDRRMFPRLLRRYRFSESFFNQFAGRQFSFRVD